MNSRRSYACLAILVRRTHPMLACSSDQQHTTREVRKRTVLCSALGQGLLGFGSSPGQVQFNSVFIITISVTRDTLHMIRYA